MEIYLKSSAGTGNEILNNWNEFSYKYKQGFSQDVYDILENVIGKAFCYQFNWSFYDQYGIASIVVNIDHIIIEESTLDTSEDSEHKFDRPLGFNNDSSLQDVFVRMLNSIGVGAIKKG